MAPTEAEPTRDDDPAAASERLLAVLQMARELAVRPKRRPVASGVEEPLLEFTEGLLRGRVVPILAGLADDPVHVAVAGGTNTGKSTVTNLLLGRGLCGMDVLARFSQHPEAYRAEATGDAWLTSGRLGTRRVYRDRHPPRLPDRELEAAAAPATAIGLLDPDRAARDAGVAVLAPPATPGAVLWDLPDFSTEQSRAWIGSVIEILAMADVVLFVVTEESYADDRGGLLLGLTTAGGARVEIVANKVAQALLPHLGETLSRNWQEPGRRRGPTADRVHRLPMIAGDSESPVERLAELVASDHGHRLREAVAAVAADRDACKAAARLGASRFLERRLPELLGSLHERLEEVGAWHAIVDAATAEELDARYHSDYLESAQFAEFDETLDLLMRRLRVPVFGDVVEGVGRVARAPLGWARGLLRHMQRGRARPQRPEEEVLEQRFEQWFGRLRAEAQARAAAAGPHGVWGGLLTRLDESDLVEGWQAALVGSYAEHRRRRRDELAQRAAAMHRDLIERPVALHSLKYGILASQVTATGLAVAQGGIGVHDLFVGPAVVGLFHWLVEQLGKGWVEIRVRELKRWQREQMRALFESTLAAPARALWSGADLAQALERAETDLARVVRALRHGVEDHR